MGEAVLVAAARNHSPSLKSGAMVSSGSRQVGNDSSSTARGSGPGSQLGPGSGRRAFHVLSPQIRRPVNRRRGTRWPWRLLRFPAPQRRRTQLLQATEGKGPPVGQARTGCPTGSQTTKSSYASPVRPCGDRSRHCRAILVHIQSIDSVVRHIRFLEELPCLQACPHGLHGSAGLRK